MADQEPGANQNMKRFSSIEKIDTGILYSLELTSSASVLPEPDRYSHQSLRVSPWQLRSD